MDKNDYFSFLNDYFYLMTVPILETEAQIYQYVGDEVVLTWYFENGIKNNNCVEVFFKIQKTLDKQRVYFQKKYKVVPQFKAGLHYGSVIRAQIGDLKKEIVFNGDVLNTASRIQSVCNQFGRNLLISSDLISHLKLDDSYKCSTMGLVELRGREEKVEIIAVESKLTGHQIESI